MRTTESARGPTTDVRLWEEVRKVSESAYALLYKNHARALYRYADVLLTATEAIAESEGATPEALGYINQLRERARFNGSIVTDFSARM